MPRDKQTGKNKLPLYPGQVIGRHYDSLLEDDLVANNQWPQDQAEVQRLVNNTMNMMIDKMRYSILSTFWQTWQDLNKKWTPEEMKKQVELYKNVIETKYGVKLCVKNNINTDMITMELLVPAKLFAADDGRESLADALQNIAMFILNMDDVAL